MTKALRRLRAAKTPHPDIKANSEPFAGQQPRCVADAIDLSDRIEDAIRRWRER